MCPTDPGSPAAATGHHDLRPPPQSIAVGEGAPTAGRGVSAWKPWPVARAVALRCVDPTRSSETGTVGGAVGSTYQGGVAVWISVGSFPGNLIYVLDRGAEVPRAIQHHDRIRNGSPGSMKWSSGLCVGCVGR